MVSQKMECLDGCTKAGNRRRCESFKEGVRQYWGHGFSNFEFFDPTKYHNLTLGQKDLMINFWEKIHLVKASYRELHIFRKHL